jgi:spermidine synthase
VQVLEGDVVDLIQQSNHEYDAIVLDVDNGPEGMVRSENDRLYSSRGLAAAKGALAPGGVLAIWSAAPDAAFTRRLREAGFQVEEVPVRTRSNGKGSHHRIWFATRLS